MPVRHAHAEARVVAPNRRSLQLCDLVALCWSVERLQRLVYEVADRRDLLGGAA